MAFVAAIGTAPEPDYETFMNVQEVDTSMRDANTAATYAEDVVRLRESMARMKKQRGLVTKTRSGGRRKTSTGAWPGLKIVQMVESELRDHVDGRAAQRMKVASPQQQEEKEKTLEELRAEVDEMLRETDGFLEQPLEDFWAEIDEMVREVDVFFQDANETAP